jgi:antitoxin ParD1/3/4
MPTRNVNLTSQLDAAVAARVASGAYENASEVVRAALRALAEREELHAARLAAVRTALLHGERSGIAEHNSIAALWKELGLPPR